MKTGDRVRALKTLFQDPDGDQPGGLLCDKGDILEIRKVGGFFPFSVAHPERPPDQMFGVKADEIEPLVERPPRPVVKIPTNLDEARAAALEYVRWFVSTGYTAEKAEAEIFMGYGTNMECGYNIDHGKIVVPSIGPGKWTFRFRTLAEIPIGQPVQQTLL